VANTFAGVHRLGFARRNAAEARHFVNTSAARSFPWFAIDACAVTDACADCFAALAFLTDAI
jgi:hypothetical protein